MTELRWRTSESLPMHVEIWAPGAEGPYDLYWGDGTSELGIAAEDAREKKFDKPGRYMAYAVYEGETEAFAKAHFQLNTKGEPNVTVAKSPDDPKVVVVTFTQEEPDDAVTAGRYVISWDGQDTQLIGGIPGKSVQHRYKVGTFSLTVEELYSGYVKTYPIEIEPAPIDPKFTVAVDDMEVTLTVEEVPSAKTGDKLRIDWHDRTAYAEIAAVKGTTATHTYAKAGQYAIIAKYVGRDRGKFVEVVVPPEA